MDAFRGGSAGDELSLALVGGPTVAQEKLVTVGAAAVQLLESDPDRVAVFFAALGGVALYVSLNKPSAINQGFQIPVASPGFGFSYRDFLSLPTQEFWGFGAGAGSVAYVLTVRRYRR